MNRYTALQSFCVFPEQKSGPHDWNIPFLPFPCRAYFALYLQVFKTPWFNSFKPPPFPFESSGRGNKSRSRLAEPSKTARGGVCSAGMVVHYVGSCSLFFSEHVILTKQIIQWLLLSRNPITVNEQNPQSKVCVPLPSTPTDRRTFGMAPLAASTAWTFIMTASFQ